MSAVVGETIEVIGYFIGFWMFIISRKYRKSIVTKWDSSSALERLFIVLGAISSLFCGVILPIIIIYFILGGRV